MAETTKCLARSHKSRAGISARRTCAAQARPWPAIDVAELRYGLTYGSSVKEIANFLQRDVDDVRHQIEVQAHKTAQGS